MIKPGHRISLSLATGLIACFPLVSCSGTDGNTPAAAGRGAAGGMLNPGFGGGGAAGRAATAGSGGSGAAVGGGATTGGGGNAGIAGSGTGGSAAAGRGGSGGSGGLPGSAGGSGGKSSGGASGSGSGGKSSGGASGSGSSGAGGTGGGSTIVGATPPMGWNSWNNFGCSPSESLLKGVADTFVSSGMAAAGYQYVNIDDCWMSGRDGSGNLVADSGKFPGGIKSLADYVHGKGLKLGIYETPNTTTCAGKTGSKGHEAQDAKTFADWGIDYLKFDLCQGPLSGLVTMHDALVATGRPIFYSVNPYYGSGPNAMCVPPSCGIDLVKNSNMWRIQFDITNTWASFTGLIDFDKPLAQYAGPGHWNDPDMLEVGRGMSADEDRSHFGMWAILAAPLIAGNDLAKMSATTKAILTNTDVIAVNQDPLGKQGTLVATSGSNQVWAKKLSGTNAYAVALFNRSGSATTITVKWSDVGLPAGSATVRDLYAQKDLGPSTDSYTSASIPSHGIVMLKIVSAP